MSTDDQRQKRRAELAEELGFVPGSLDPESIARHRADAARDQRDRKVEKQWAHHGESSRQRQIEADGHAVVSDLFG